MSYDILRTELSFVSRLSTNVLANLHRKSPNLYYTYIDSTVVVGGLGMASLSVWALDRLSSGAKTNSILYAAFDPITPNDFAVSITVVYWSIYDRLDSCARNLDKGFEARIQLVMTEHLQGRRFNKYGARYFRNLVHVMQR